jgi:hypothetical protein
MVSHMDSGSSSRAGQTSRSHTTGEEQHVKRARVRAKNAVRWILTPRIHAALITMRQSTCSPSSGPYAYTESLDQTIWDRSRTF